MKIILFGIVKDIIGETELEFDLEIGKTIKDLQEKLLVEYPKLKELKKFAFAVNEMYASADTVLKDTDIVAIIPPVSGG